MSEETPEKSTEEVPEKMSENQKLMYAVFGAIAIGFLMVGLSKEEQTKEQKEGASMIRNVVAMQEMASQKCTKAIMDKTGEQVYFPSGTDSDKETYVTLKWVGENSQKGGFKTASCTLNGQLGGISELIIDGKEIIKKKI
jgi:hypothetical protein